jgi:hypothetical protein
MISDIPALGVRILCSASPASQPFLCDYEHGHVEGWRELINTLLWLFDEVEMSGQEI